MRTALRRGMWVVLLAGVLLGGLSAAYVLRAEGAGVTSTAQLVVTGRAESSQDNALTASQYVNQRMSTYAAVATTDAVLDPAADSLGVDGSALAGAVTAVVPLQTTVIDVAVTGDAPRQAQERAQAVLVSLSDQITELETQPGASARVDVRVLSSASLPAVAALPSVPVAAAVGLVLGLLLGVAAVVASYVFRTRQPGLPDPAGAPGASGAPGVPGAQEPGRGTPPSGARARQRPKGAAAPPQQTGSRPAKR